MVKLNNFILQPKQVLKEMILTSLSFAARANAVKAVSVTNEKASQ